MPVSTNKQSWSIGITCYNEEATIRRVVENIQQVLKQIASKYEIIIVDDASIDNSRKIIKELAKKYFNIKTIYHQKNMGIGATIKDIYFNAKYENLTYVPGDAQFDIQELLPFAKIEDQTYISFYRKQNESYSNLRTTLSFVNKMINKYFIGLNLKDVNWVNVYKRKEIANLNIQINSSIIVSEICAKLNIMGYKPIEVISTYHPRIAGESRGASLKNVIEVALETIKLIKVVWRFKRNYKRKLKNK